MKQTPNTNSIKKEERDNDWGKGIKVKEVRIETVKKRKGEDRKT